MSKPYVAYDESGKRTNAPSPHMIASLFNSGMDTVDAISEFIDNSFGQDAGAATEFHFHRHGRRFMQFIDNGVGVADINDLFCIGSSSSYASARDLGQFGVGAKFASLSFGSKVKVETVRCGIYHRFSEDFAALLKEGRWPAWYSGDGKLAAAANVPEAIRTGGTLISISGIHEFRTQPKLETIAKRLGMRFMGHLLDGKKIYLHDADQLKRIDVSDYVRHVIEPEEIETASFSVNGMPGTIRFGATQKHDPVLNGLHISFGGRVIETWKYCDTVLLPLQFWGHVELEGDWKYQLNSNKTKLIDHAADLATEIYAIVSTLVDKLNAKRESTTVTLILDNTAESLAKAFGSLVAAGTKQRAADTEVSPLVRIKKKSGNASGGGGGGHNLSGNRNPPKNNADIEDAEDGAFDPASGAVEIEVREAKDDIDNKYAYVCNHDFTGNRLSITVTLNVKNPHMLEAMRAPVQSAAIVSTVAQAVATDFMGDELGARKLFKGLADDYGFDDSNVSPVEFHRALYSYLVSNMPAVKQPTTGEIAKNMENDDE